MDCDLCNRELAKTTGIRVPIAKTQRVVRAGFDPFSTCGIDPSHIVRLAGFLGTRPDEGGGRSRQVFLPESPAGADAEGE